MRDMEKDEFKKYIDFYKSELGREIAEKEAEFVWKRLKDCKNILSIGCGPAIIERKLRSRGLDVVGLDKSMEMLLLSDRQISLVVGDAESLPFKDKSFDCALFLTSIEFIDDPKKSLSETRRVVRRKALFLILNPRSIYFAERTSKKGSYIKKHLKHMDIKRLRSIISDYFSIELETYFLGIRGKKVFDTENPNEASLYVLEGHLPETF